MLCRIIEEIQNAYLITFHFLYLIIITPNWMITFCFFWIIMINIYLTLLYLTFLCLTIIFSNIHNVYLLYIFLFTSNIAAIIMISTTKWFKSKMKDFSKISKFNFWLLMRYFYKFMINISVDPYPIKYLMLSSKTS